MSEVGRQEGYLPSESWQESGVSLNGKVSPAAASRVGLTDSSERTEGREQREEPGG